MTINKVRIHNIATYRSPVDFEPRKINFLFGSNGCGKTTISNLLGGYINSEHCEIVNDTDQILVYNKKFVESNFASQVKGIFSLGEDSVSVQSQVQELNLQIEKKRQDINRKRLKTEELENNILTGRESLKEECWKIQQDLGPAFPKALTGVRKSKEIFLSRLLEESQKSTDHIAPYEELLESYDLTFSSENTTYKLFELLDIQTIDNLQDNTLLNKKIMGSANAPIGQFIEYLQNSDWVRSGLSYLSKSDSKCPFCHQALPKNFEREIGEYFDVVFEREVGELVDFISKYTTFFEDVLKKIIDIVDTDIPFLDISDLKNAMVQFEAITNLNYEHLAKKQELPSHSIELVSVSDICQNINVIITELNSKIEKNNQISVNQRDEQSKFKQKLWGYIVKQAESLISQFSTLKNGMEKGIEGIEKSIFSCETEERQLCETVTELEKNLTSITPTIKAINGILKKFGFKGFKLGENESQSGTYKIIRDLLFNFVKALYLC
ncbi:AAA family ATPase [Enterococcus sp. DIV0876]|uniref:AAA family ATPase n=1 Tax=Enterococcus sp. DIV0876 TaxID=2774633 RepID=UPI003D300225